MRSLLIKLFIIFSTSFSLWGMEIRNDDPDGRYLFMEYRMLEQYYVDDLAKNILQCFCGEAFNSSAEIKAHIYNNHFLTKISNDIYYLCSICNRFFVGLNRMLIHCPTHTHEILYSCEQCQLNFSEFFDAVDHKAMHKLGKRKIRNSIHNEIISQGNIEQDFSSAANSSGDELHRNKRPRLEDPSIPQYSYDQYKYYPIVIASSMRNSMQNTNEVNAAEEAEEEESREAIQSQQSIASFCAIRDSAVTSIVASNLDLNLRVQRINQIRLASKLPVAINSFTNTRKADLSCIYKSLNPWGQFVLNWGSCVCGEPFKTCEQALGHLIKVHSYQEDSKTFYRCRRDASRTCNTCPCKSLDKLILHLNCFYKIRVEYCCYECGLNDIDWELSGHLKKHGVAAI